ncbi:MAG: sulfite dehydrogenase [Rhodospirillales bacterium]|nr:sulfite dehydrogenase [Rhodospirillales bacterium]
MRESPKPLSRRRALAGASSAAFGAGALLAGRSVRAATAPALPRLNDRGGWPDEAPDAADLPPNVPPWMQTPGRPLSPYGIPSPHESAVVRVPTNLTPTALASWNFTPLQHLHGTITPNGLHFERLHAGVPDIDPAQHRLLIHGMVKRPLVLSMDDLMRYPSVSRIHFLECSGNTLTEWRAPVGKTVQVTHGLLSCAEWTGVPLAAVLDAVGVDPKAKWALAEGADAAAMARSIPVAKLWDDAILAFAQNGEMLRPSQGYPLRLLLPGFEGNTNIKWLRRLKFGTAPFETYEETAYYTELMKSGLARQFNFVMEAKSVITYPSAGQKLGRPGFCQITGLAWSGNGRVSRVDISTARGQHWQSAELQQPVLSRALTRFRFNWEWTGRPAVLQSRCFDETGYVQPTLPQLVSARGLNSVYHMNAIQSWQIAAGGEVTNVHA